MGMIIRVKGVNWSGKGFPLANGFIAQANLEAAFDFRPRVDRLTEASGKGFVAIPYLNKLDGTVSADPAVIQNTANGLGLIVKNGFLDFGIANKTYVAGGAAAFTMMVVGGYSGQAFEAGQPANNAVICNLVDMGNGVTNAPSLPMLQQYQTDGTLGARVTSSYASNIGAAEVSGKKTCFFLSYDGAKFTYTNKTTGAVVVKTNAELGIVDGPLVPHARVQNLASGNYYKGTTAVIGLYPELYQLARWNKVLSPAEMQDQYNSSRLLFSKVGI
jgi:hypothetical protein